ncbi:acyltransferase family protein [Fibrobacter sp. UWP2]|uniref:acyltransferase family protein n=1 Tax=Fibrobacter sp. UWP2 TaxID=1896216 RepID=UPI00091BE742|nr:acyltransferase family protein [Fibrobacter sp. UWP2]SHI53388.1 hypothetical protein SAMN05720471_10387 [Fibrobacter sp. UWP2]
MESKRIEYIDTAKFLAMILIVFSHGAKEGNLIAFLFSFHLPVFFFLNGMTLKIGNQTFADFLVKKLKRYVLPMFGLGILCVLFDYLIRSLTNTHLTDHDILYGFSRIINQTRAYAIWFLTALFFVDLMLFGLIFTYFGYAFHHPKCTKVYNLLTRRRMVGFIVGLCLMYVTYLLSVYNYTTQIAHLEMFSRIYRAAYITLPCALIGCFGFTLLCRGITNPVLAKPVEINLALLAFHQVLAFPLFMNFIAKDWWIAVWSLPTTDPRFLAYVLTATAFAIALSAAIHFLLKYSPLSLIVNQPLPDFYRKKSLH